MGDEGRAGSTDAELTAALRTGYEAAADEWASGPERMYARLAQALVEAAPVPMAGIQVLDVGSGTGVAGRAALAAGARRVVAADLATGMLRRARSALAPVAADAAALPFRDDSFDLVLAAFCLNHLSVLGTGLREARRVGRAIAASTFAAGWSHPAKEAVDGVLQSAGYQPPAWYQSLNPGSRASDPDLLAGQAAAAGFADVRVRTASIPTGLFAPEQLVSWRLGMAHVAPFVRSMDPPRRAELRRAAEYAVAGSGPLNVAMTMLTAR